MPMTTLTLNCEDDDSDDASTVSDVDDALVPPSQFTTLNIPEPDTETPMVVDDSTILSRSTRMHKPNQRYAGIAHTVTWFDENMDLAEACAVEAHPIITASSTDALSWEPAPESIHDILKLPESPIHTGWLKSVKSEFKTLVDSHTFSIEYIRDNKVSIPVMEIFKEKIKSDGMLDKLKTHIVVHGDLQGKSTMEDKWSPTASF
jgi:hypothetical protein